MRLFLILVASILSLYVIPEPLDTILEPLAIEASKYKAAREKKIPTTINIKGEELEVDILDYEEAKEELDNLIYVLKKRNL